MRSAFAAVRSLISRPRRNRPKSRLNRERVIRHGSLEALELRQMMASDPSYAIYTVPDLGTPNSVVTFTPKAYEAGHDNRLYYFVVESEDTSGHSAAELGGRYLFDKDGNPGPTTVSLPKGTKISWFMRSVHDGTEDIFYAMTENNHDGLQHFSDGPEEVTGEDVGQYGFEDIYRYGGQAGEPDYNDLTFDVTAVADYNLPKISIAAGTEYVSEGVDLAMRQGYFTFTRTGSTASSLTVDFKTDKKGANIATEGQDYEDISIEQVTFPAGQSTVYFPITALNDAIENEPDEKIIVTLTGGGTNYKIDSAQSTATILIKDNDYEEGNSTPWYCPLPGGGCDSPATASPHSGQAQASALNSNLLSDLERAVIQLAGQLPNAPAGGAASVPTSVTVQTDFKDASNVTVGTSTPTYYSTAGLSAGDSIQLTGDVPVSGLSTGMYNWEMTVTYHYSGGSTKTQNYAGKQAVVKRDDVGLGAGWNLDGFERLYLQSNGALWVMPNGATLWFAKNTDGTYRTSPGDSQFGTLAKLADNTFKYTAKDKSECAFDANGLLTSCKDRAGNITTYSYLSGKLTEIRHNNNTTNPRVTTYNYTGARLTSVVSYDGTTTSYLYDGNNRLWKVVETDPDGPTEPKLSPETKFEYDASGRIWKVTDARNNVTEFIYDFSGRVKEIIQPCSGHWKLKPQQSLGLVDRNAASQNGTSASPAVLTRPGEVEIADERQLTTKYKLDRFGGVLVMTDHLQNKTLYERNEHGQVIKMISPDPGTAAGQIPLVTRYAYDNKGNLINEFSPDGSLQTWSYDPSFSQVTEYVNQEGDRTIYTVNSTTGNVDAVRQVMGALDVPGGETDDIVTSFTYTNGTDGKPIGQVKTIVDPLNHTTEYTYTARGLVETLTEAKTTIDQRTTTFQYDTAENLRFQTDALGRITEWQYDNLNRNTKRLDPDPDLYPGVSNGSAPVPVTQFDYNALGLVETIIEPWGETTTYAYDNRNRLDVVTSEDPDGAAGPLPRLVTSYDYDCVGNLTFVYLPGGRTIEYVYDELNRLKKEILPNPDPAVPTNKPITEYGYDNLGRLSWVKDDHAQQTDYAYDDMSRLITVTQPSPDGIAARPIWTTTYTRAGEVRTEVDPEGRVTTYTYDDAGRLKTVEGVDPDGPTGAQVSSLTTYDHGKTGNIDSIRQRVDAVIANDLVTSYLYDNLDRLKQELRPNNEQTNYKYDAADNLKELDHGPGDVTLWKYDQLDRVIEETDPVGQSRHSWLYQDGQLWTAFDRNGNQIAYSYDNLGRLTGEEWLMEGRWFEYFYDELGRLDSVADSHSLAPDYDFAYDRLDRLVETNWQIQGSTIELLNSYDDLSNRTERQMWLDGQFWTIDTSVYDNLSRVKSFAHGNVDTDEVSAAFGYNRAGQLENVKRYHTSVSPANLMADTRYTYDPAGRLDKLDHFDKNNVKLDGWDYGYDAAGRIMTIGAHHAAQSVSYTYDKAGQLKTADYNGLVDESYNYNQKGNRDLANGVTSVIAANNRLSDDGTFTYTYDDEGNRLTKVRKSTAQADDKTVEYAWDQRQRLSTVTFKRNDGTVTKSVEYLYDVFDRMTHRVVDPDGATGMAQLQREDYMWDGDEMFAKLDDVTGFLHYYVHSPVTGELLFDNPSYTVGNGAAHATLTDHLGTVHDLVNKNGQVVNHLVYDAFGNRKSETNPQGGAVPFSPDMGFTGQYFDAVVGLQYNHHRWYDAATGRWISEDPIGFAGGDANLYRYVGNGVTRYVDPTGLQGIDGSFPQLYESRSYLTPPENQIGSVRLLEDSAGYRYIHWTRPDGSRELTTFCGRPARYGRGGEPEPTTDPGAPSLSEPSTGTLALDAIGTYAGTKAAKFGYQGARWLVGKAGGALGRFFGWGASHVDDAAHVASSRSIRGLQKQLDAHKRKLADYIKDPHACDNQGLLKNAPTDEIRKRIIDSRIRRLERQIENFQKQIDDAR